LTYASNLNNDSESSQFLAVMKPRRVNSTTWVNDTGARFIQTFSFGRVIDLTEDGTTLTLVGSAGAVTGSPGSWFFDIADNTLYVHTPDSTTPANNTMVSIYELYVGTIDAYFNRDPTDSTSETVFFDGIITKIPKLKQQATQNFFGFAPTQLSQLSLTNITKFLQIHIFASSFHKADIKIYHVLGNFETANFKLFTTGIMGDIASSDTSIQINVFDNTNLFDAFVRNSDLLSTARDFYTGATIGIQVTEPVYVSKPVRQVYGVVDGFVPVNVDYEVDTPLSTNNRDWLCIHNDNTGAPAFSAGDKSGSVTQSPTAGSTTTKTNLVSADGIRVGDSVLLDAGPFFVEALTVDKSGSPNFITHAAIAAPVTTGLAKRHFIGSIKILHKGIIHTAFFTRDYTDLQLPAIEIIGFRFNGTAFGATPTIPTWPVGDELNPRDDKLFCRIYGPRVDSTIDITGAVDSTETKNLTNGIAVLFRILKEGVGISSSLLGTSFTTLLASISDELGFAISPLSTGGFPKYRTIINQILQSLLLKMFIDDSGVLQIAQTGPLGSVDKTLEDDEIVADSFNYSFGYRDIVSDVSVNYDFREVSERGTQLTDVGKKTIKDSSDTAKFLHNIKRDMIVDGLFYRSSEATTLARRLAFALGDRRGRLKLNTRNRFLDTDINDVVKIQRTRLAGFAFDKDTERTEEFSVNAHQKGFGNTQLEMDDQKGIEDNKASF